MKKRYKILTLLPIFASVLSFGQPIPNGDFETWVSVDSQETLRDWDYFEGFLGLDASVAKSTDKVSGNFAAKVQNTFLDFGTFSDTIGGFLSTQFPATSKPKYFNGYYKANMVGNDVAQIGFGYKDSTTTYLLAYFYVYASTSEFVSFSEEIDYFNTNVPTDSFSVMVFSTSASLTASNKPNTQTWLIVDNFSLSDEPLSVENIDYSLVGNLGPNPSAGNVSLTLPQTSSEVQVDIRDLEGATVYSTTTYTANSGLQMDLKHLPKGIYQLLATSGGRSFRRKLILQ